MILRSVNLGHERPLDMGRQLVPTGIFKAPSDGPVRIGKLGLAGDFIADARHHGGPDQAVYVYGSIDYDWWAHELGEAMAPGTFGDNLTVAGLESAGCAVGDRLAIGDTVVVEVSAPRIPCATLARRMGDPQFVKRFRDAERPGLYCRVIVEGNVRIGDPVGLTPYAGDRVTALELFRENYATAHDAATLHRFLAPPLAERERRHLLAHLEKLPTPPA